MRAFVIAMACEAEAVCGALRPDDRLYVSGIGKVNAAAVTQKAIDEGATEIVNAGVAGGFEPAMAIGDVFEVDRAVEYDFDLADLNGTAVGVHDERTTPYFACVTTGRFPVRTLATGDHFRDDENDLGLFRALGVGLRDMEGAAIAHVCERNGVPCRLVKSVVDVHGAGSMTGQYKEHLARGLQTLAEALKRSH